MSNWRRSARDGCGARGVRVKDLIFRAVCAALVVCLLVTGISVVVFALSVLTP